ncbi:hypothetical protein BDV35DRAFT_339862 [Aspergillus flavus]|uniref:Uncharacterized protein n=1 Tax=Aspergillus flavus TaxID=5059 RepID=A0A5N6HBH1_ASPFL|nr:hypothetical protein BDV35DRAFT_339862 [Aspergillus flavus]
MEGGMRPWWWIIGQRFLQTPGVYIVWRTQHSAIRILANEGVMQGLSGVIGLPIYGYSVLLPTMYFRHHGVRNL